MKMTWTLFARRFFCVFFTIFSFIITTPAQSIEKDFPEAKIKAAYLFNFLRFIEWPENHNVDTHICVVGRKDEYRDAFKSLSGQSLNNQNVIIREMNDVDSQQALYSCQIIFVTSTASHRQKMLFNTLKHSKALTVGETHGFAQQGGMINFIEKDGKIRFEINLRSANEAGLRITSKILRIAENVINGEHHE